MGVLQLLLSLMDNQSVLWGHTFKVDDSIIPTNARVVKSRISNIVSTSAKIEELEKRYWKRYLKLKKRVRELEEGTRKRKKKTN